jgi:hypothetical protein
VICLQSNQFKRFRINKSRNQSAIPDNYYLFNNLLKQIQKHIIMKNLILLVAISICLFACTSTSQKNIEIVKSYVKSVENMDYNSMETFLADDYLGLGPSYGDSINKADAVEYWKMNVSNLYEKIQYNRSRYASVTIPDGESKGEWVANWAELNIVYKNGMGSATIWANTNYLIENGKIKRSLTFYNEADVLRQLGFLMTRKDENN